MTEAFAGNFPVLNFDYSAEQAELDDAAAAAEAAAHSAVALASATVELTAEQHRNITGSNIRVPNGWRNHQDPATGAYSLRRTAAPRQNAPGFFGPATGPQG